MKILGVDWGEKRIGLAIADGGFATPYGIISSATELIAVVKKERIEEVLLGLPEGKNESRVRRLGRKIEALGVPVFFRSEVLTSRLAQQKLIEAGKPRKARRNLDAASAAFLLQEYLDNS